MYEYKVDIYKVKYAEEAMNTLAKDGWRVIAISPDHHTGFIDVFYEREAAQSAAENANETAGSSAAGSAAAGSSAAGSSAAGAAVANTEHDDKQYAVREDIWDFDGTEESEDNT